MRSLSRGHLAKRWQTLQAGLQNAFATQPAGQPLSPDDVELMERIAGAIVARDMAAPATIFLESMGPMNFLGSQALHFLAPIIDCAFNAKEVEQVARLLERRDTVTCLIAIIEAKSAPKGAPAR